MGPLPEGDRVSTDELPVPAGIVTVEVAGTMVTARWVGGGGRTTVLDLGGLSATDC